MTEYNEARLEYRQLVALYAQLAEFVQTHTIDDIDKMVMDGTFAAEWPEIDADAPPAVLPKWSELKPADPSRVRWLGHAERTPDEDRRDTQGRNLAKTENPRIHLRGVTKIREALARELAKALDLTVNDGLSMANLAPVAALGATVWTKFQIPLKAYFHDVLHLSDEIVRLWAEATLLIQRHPHGLRLILHSPPQGWALVVSLGGQIAMVLGEKAQTIKITCADAEIDRHQMAIVPFEQSP